MAQASAQDTPVGLAVDAASVYWSTDSSNGPGISKVPLGGGTPEIIASSPGLAKGVVVDATSVYWADSSDGTIMKLTPK